MTRVRRGTRALWLSVLLSGLPPQAFAHSGPPFPALSDRVAGPYRLSLWTDPDTTEDGSAAGQFWVVIHLADGSQVPPDTHAIVAIRPLDRPGPERSAVTSPVDGDTSRQFVALLMDHEGSFAVRATISGTRGSAVVDATVDATYDLRPAPWLVVVYLLPFVAVGFLWLKLLLRRRARVPANTP
jgi:hypothetical protein